jgi:ketosteroid isomerase-like protein
MRNLAPVAAAIALASCAHPLESPGAADSLAAAEAAFAAQSVREDMRAAFLAHFADDGLFVRDGWTPARAWLASRPPPPIVLDWRPVYVEVASSGDLGLSTGPWRATPKQDAAAAPAHGQFVSIWKRAPGQPWKVAVDLGISHPGDALWTAPLETRVAAGGGHAGSLADAEAAFARDCARAGQRAAYGAHGSAQLRRYRDGEPPAAALAAALASPSMTEARTAWTASHVEAARSGDFGYAIGSYATPATPAIPAGHFLRAWRHEAGGWKIVLDVVNASKR